MIEINMRRFTLLVFAGLLVGCASSPERDGFEDVRTDISGKIDKQLQWYQSASDDDALPEQLETLLADTLSSNEAVQIALLNNRQLQAIYEELGIAQAQLIQAGLVSNPVLEAGFFEPQGAGAVELGLEILQDLLSVIHRPKRERIAAAEYDAVTLEVTTAVLGLAAAVEVAYYDVQAAMQRCGLWRQVALATELSSEAAQRLYEAGNTTKLHLAQERALHVEAQLALTIAEADAVIARDRLNGLMGLSGPSSNWQLGGQLPEMPAAPLDLSGIETDALAASLELKIAKHRIDAAAERLGLTDATRLVPELEIGVGGEREDGEWEVGPAVILQIPMFDRGQARHAAALAELRRAQQSYLAIGTDLRAEARKARETLAASRDRALRVRETLIPLSVRVVDETQRQYNAMQVGVFDLLNAKRQQIGAGVQYIETLHDYWRARVDVELLRNGRSPGSAGVRRNSAVNMARAERGGH